MKTLTFFILLMVLSAMNNFAQTPPVEAGVSQTLARWRAANYSDVRYKLNLTLDKQAPLMKGEIEIRVNLTETAAKTYLVLDWRTTQFENDNDKPFAEVVKVNEAVIKGLPDSGEYAYSINREHIVIAQRLLKKGENVIKIAFASPIKTSGAALTRYTDKEDGAEYVYSLFVPSDASTAFPVFDQPDLKARFSLELAMPQGWKAISNTDSLNKPRNTQFGGRNIQTLNNAYFAETQPISTYVFAFAAGEFAEFDERSEDQLLNEIDKEKRLQNEVDKDGRTFISDNESRAGNSKIYVRKSQAEKFKAHEKEIFRLNREAVNYLGEYFDYKFPFPKYDLVLIPEFPFGGMEHAGSTFLRESAVIFPQEPTKNDFVSRANLIFHEAAHQWFGDTVTMRWFDDLWLKEGFAEFMAYKTLEKVMPEMNAWKIFYERNKQLAYLTDSTRGTTPIYQEIQNLSAAKSAYGNIVYRKAPSFLRQAEFYLGEKDFQTAIRAFLKKNQFKNASWEDLLKEFEAVYLVFVKKEYPGSEEDFMIVFRRWADTFVKKRGVPVYRVILADGEVKQEGDTRVVDGYTLKIEQTNPAGEKEDYLQNVRLLSRLNGKDYFENSLFGISGLTESFSYNDVNYMTVPVPAKIPRPDFFFPNYQDYGYGIFLLDEKSRAYVVENIQTEKDDFLRTMMWGALWDSVREAELAPETYVELVIKNISVETDESTINTLLSRVGTAMNYYLPDARREEIAPRLETLLIEKMQKSETLGQRITFYRAFLNTVSSETARNVLKEILSGKVQIEDFKLKSKDKFDIVTRLLILVDKDAANLLAGLEKSETSDEAKRYAYAARAGIATDKNKLKFWNDFTGNKDLSESWIEAAFVSFNAPRHADLTLPYLEKALAELPNLKRNRKIFFVNGWLAAFIGGQRSEEALRIVNKFLTDNPNLDKDLRLKILENVDLIERAVKIRKVKSKE